MQPSQKGEEGHVKGDEEKEKGHNNKKSTTKSDQRERDLASTHIGQLFQWFEDRQYIMPPYNFE
jgi:hypothetical protein